MEYDKLLDATRTLKVSKADLSKAREELEEMKKARDIAESGLPSAQKQALDQTEYLLKAEDQLRVAKEEVATLEKKVLKAKGPEVLRSPPGMRP